MEWVEWRNAWPWVVCGTMSVGVAWCSAMEEAGRCNVGVGVWAETQEQWGCNAAVVGVGNFEGQPVGEVAEVVVGPVWWREGTGRGSVVVWQGWRVVRPPVRCKKQGSYTGKGTGRTG